MGGIVQAALKTRIAKTLAGRRRGRDVLNHFSSALIDKIDNLKFLAYVDGDGYPFVIPVIQAQTTGTDRIVFASSVYREDLRAIPPGTATALFGMSFQMQTVLLRGKFSGLRSIGGVQCGEIEIDWIYSPMPPKAEQVYPPKKLEAVTEF